MFMKGFGVFVERLKITLDLRYHVESWGACMKAFLGIIE